MRRRRRPGCYSCIFNIGQTYRHSKLSHCVVRSLRKMVSADGKTKSSAASKVVLRDEQGQDLHVVRRRGAGLDGGGVQWLTLVFFFREDESRGNFLGHHIHPHYATRKIWGWSLQQSLWCFRRIRSSHLLHRARKIAGAYGEPGPDGSANWLPGTPLPPTLLLSDLASSAVPSRWPTTSGAGRDCFDASCTSASLAVGWPAFWKASARAWSSL